MNIGIIGGGIAGLTAAYELGKAGHSVTIFEARDDLGGQAATFPIEQTRLEIFYHHIFTNDREIVALIDELGLQSQLDWLESKVGFFCDGRIYSFVTPRDLLTFRPIPPLDRLRLGLATVQLQRRTDWHSLEDITAREWMLEHIGQKAFDKVWGAQLRGKFGELADEVSMVWFWGKIHLRLGSRDKGISQERLGYMRGSYQVLVDTLTERVRQAGGLIHTNAPVQSVVVEDGRAVGVTTPEGRFDFERIIATVPSNVFLRLVPEIPESYASLLRRVEYQAALCLVLKLDRSFSHIYWLNIGDPSSPFVGVIEQTNFIPPENYGGKHVVYVANYLSRNNPLYSLPADRLLEAYRPHLRKINPSFDPSWVQEMWLFREDAAQPVITTRYSRYIPEHATPIANLFLANTTQIYPEDRGMNYSVRLGQDIAKIVTGTNRRGTEEAKGRRVRG